MDKKLVKIISKNEIYLVEPIENSIQSNEILYGNAVRMSINTTNSYYFATEIKIIHRSNILFEKEVNNDEKFFFEWMRSEKEIPFSKKIVDLYNIKDFKELNKK